MVRITQSWVMRHRGPEWLVKAMENRPRGFQAEVARRANMTTDKLNKSISGGRKLSDEEGQAIRDAIEDLDREARQPRPEAPNEAPEGSRVIDRIIGRKPSTGRPAELVFLLRDRDYLVFQLDDDHLHELREAVREMMDG